MDDVNKYASSILKKLRKERHLTQAQLASNLNITQQQIARYETGTRKFKQNFLFILSSYFDVPIDTFFPNKLNNFKKNENVVLDETHKLDQIIMEKTKELSEEDKKKIIEIIDIYTK